MVDFLQEYGLWIVFGALFLFMLRGRGHGIGCRMGDHRANQAEDMGGSPDQARDGTDHRSAGCH